MKIFLLILSLIIFYENKVIAFSYTQNTPDRKSAKEIVSVIEHAIDYPDGYKILLKNNSAYYTLVVPKGGKKQEVQFFINNSIKNQANVKVLVNIFSRQIYSLTD